MQKRELIGNIFTTLPSIMKRLMVRMPEMDMPRQQMMLLHIICEHDNMPMRFYSEHMMISKPNLTVLADKLIESGYVERYPAEHDRRIVNLCITDKGREFMETTFSEMVEAMMTRFESVDENKLVRMNELVAEMNELVNGIAGSGAWDGPGSCRTARECEGGGEVADKRVAAGQGTVAGQEAGGGKRRAGDGEAAVNRGAEG